MPDNPDEHWEGCGARAQGEGVSRAPLQRRVGPDVAVLLVHIAVCLDSYYRTVVGGLKCSSREKGWLSFGHKFMGTETSNTLASARLFSCSSSSVYIYQLNGAVSLLIPIQRSIPAAGDPQASLLVPLWRLPLQLGA